MIQRLPRYAELEVQRVCAEAGALCHSVDEDESGWDRLIELPEKSFFGHADTQSPRSSAYVQVKSTKTANLSCKIKLSNALRAAQSLQPWFIVLVSQDVNKSIKLYAVHFWKELIGRTLKAVREAENYGHPLHRREMIIRFGAQDKRDDKLVEWITSEIEGSNNEYHSAKQAIYRNIGYEDGFGSGTLRIRASSEEEIYKNFLGIGDGLQLDEFSLVPQRFGILSNHNIVQLFSGLVRINPDPVGQAEIRLRRQAGGRAILFTCDVYNNVIPNMPPGKRMVRFSSEILQIVLKNKIDADFKLHIESEKAHRFEILDKYISIRAMLQAGAIDIQIWYEGRRAFAGELKIPESTQKSDWTAASRALEFMKFVTGYEDIKFRLSDLAQSSSLKTISDLSLSSSFRIDFDLSPELSIENSTDVCYWIHSRIGLNDFFIIASRPIISKLITDGRVIITAGEQVVLESYFAPPESPIDPNIIDDDFERNCNFLSQNGSPIAIGDIRALVENRDR